MREATADAVRLMQAHERTLTVPCRHGLHLRTAALVVETAKRFESDIQLAIHGQRADAKSILGLLHLAAAHLEQVRLTVTGPDAEAAADAIAALFASTETFCVDGG